MNSPQLPLPISLPNDETFASFYVGDNQLLLDALSAILAAPTFKSFYFWSSSSSGRTHLLHAACSYYASQGKSVSYIPLDEYKQLAPEILFGLQNYDLVCLDNIENIAGNKQWENSIFDLFNLFTEQQVGKMLITAHATPKNIPFSLPDLVSRLTWGQVYQLKELSDDDKLRALQLRANQRGFELPTEVGLFLLKRVDRDMRSLFLLLEQLDKATITEQRKLTIPFIKDILKL